VSEVVFLLHRVMAEPPPVQRPLQVRAQEVLANVQAAPQAPVPELPAPQGPQVALAAPAHVVAAENADAGNANQNPGLPEPPLEVNNGLSFHVRLVFYLSVILVLFEVCFVCH
jgi:hypothetical protein